MMEKPLSGIVMVIPGIAFISVGLLIVLWPSLLPWLVAGASILAGTAMLLMANFMRGIGDRLRRAGGFPGTAPPAPGPRTRL
jgi:hypothetical protein